jgi:hypothetical protein
LQNFPAENGKKAVWAKESYDRLLTPLIQTPALFMGGSLIRCTSDADGSVSS